MRQRYELPTRAASLAAAALASLAMSNCATPDTSPPGREGPNESFEAADSPEKAADAAASATMTGRVRSDAGPEVVTSGSTPSQRFTHDPIGAVGHGALITVDGKVVSRPTPQFIRDAQGYYIDRLLGEADPSIREEFEIRQRSPSEYEDQGEIAENAADFSWLLDKVAPADEAVLASINRFLAEKGGAEDATGYGREPYFIETTNSGENYVKECQENGVPIPPVWGSDDWKHRGHQETVLISGNLHADVYVYDTNPLGVCYALPRSYPDGMIELFGVICQGNESNKACFWDNKTKPLDPKKVTNLTEGDFIGGSQLVKGKDVCTDCHRGENVFIVHPDTPLDLRFPTSADPRPREGLQTQFPSGWVEPLVPAGWPQNAKPRPLLESIKLDLKGNETTPPDGDCLYCHNEPGQMRLGELSGGYCLSVIVPSINRGLMPPLSWLKEFEEEGRTPPSFHKHSDAIREACKDAKAAVNK